MIAKYRSILSDRESGFTLIELLVVVLTIGILAAIAIPVYVNQQKVATDAKTVSDINSMNLVIATQLTKTPFATNFNFITIGNEYRGSSGSTVIVYGVPGDYCLKAWNTAGSKYYDTTTPYYIYISKTAEKGSTDKYGQAGARSCYAYGTSATFAY